MPEFLSPGHIVTEDPSIIATIEGVTTSTGAIIGVAEKGPINQATLCTSFSDFRTKFGGFINDGWLAHAALGIWSGNSQARVFVVRVAHYADVSDAATITAVIASVTLKDRHATVPANTLKVSALNAGAWGNGLKVKIEDSGTTGLFNLKVYETEDVGDVLRESWRNLSMSDTSDRFVESIINGSSKYIVVEDQDSATTGGLDIPALGTFSLTGGDDGLTGITDNDYLGSYASKTGLYALDKVPEMLMVAIPGMTSANGQNAILDYCSERQDCFALLDPPFGYDKQEIKEYIETTAALSSTYGAVYWPNVVISDPITALDKVVPPSGFIMGAYGRTDRDRGVWKVAAGVEDGDMPGVIGLETDEVNEKAVRDYLYPYNINPICKIRGYGIKIYGARTLDSTDQFPYINERRTFIYCEKSITEGTQFAEFENNSETLWQQLRLAIKSFLNFVWRQDGLRGTAAGEAYDVKIDSETNPQEYIDRGICQGYIGLATHRPAEFIWFRYYRKTASSDAAE